MNVFRRIWCAATHGEDHCYVGGYMYRLWACRACGRRWTECRR